MEDKAFDKKNKAKNKGPWPTHLFAIFREAQRQCKKLRKKKKKQQLPKRGSGKTPSNFGNSGPIRVCFRVPSA
jgi:hypothetical protein